MKMFFSFKTPIGYAIAGSFFLHIILVSIYGTLLASGNVPPPPPLKKFKIEMVSKKPDPIQKVAVKEKKINDSKQITPIKITQPHPAYSAQKIRKKEIALQPVSRMVPAKPKMVEEIKANLSQKSFQMAKADISANTVVPRPRTIEKLFAGESIASKVQRSATGIAKSADISPLPRPVKNVRIFSKVSGKETSFHASAAGFDPSGLQSRSISVASFSSERADQNRAVEFKRGFSSSSISSTQAVIRPSAPEFESVTTPDRATTFYEAKTRTVSTLPSAKVLSVAPSSSSTIGSNRRAEFVQKGELVAAVTFSSPRPVPEIVDPRVLDGYLGTLQALIASAKKYPESARKSGQEGKVTVQFTVMQNGNVKNIQLVSKTNYRVLNEEAIEAVKRAAPFSGFPDEIDKPFLDIILPFRFKLNE